MLLNKFRPVIGFEDLYLISPIGEIYIIKRRVIKKPYLTNGYLKTHLRKNGEYHSKYIHRLVAEAYVENPNQMPIVNHIDGNKLNNDFRNLEWVTAYENSEHARSIGKNPVKGNN